MSANVAAADPWVADLEDIFGLSSAASPEAEAERGSIGERGRSRLLPVAALVLGLVLLALVVVRSDLFSSGGGTIGDAQPAARVEPRVTRPDLRSVPAGPATAVAPDVKRNAITAGRERAVLASVGARKLSRPAPIDRRTRAVSDRGERASAALVGVETDAAPDLSGTMPAPVSRDVRSADDQIVVVPVPAAAPRANAVTDQGPAGSDTIPSAPAMTPSPAATAKPARNKADAIDALRMLRRQ